MKDKNHALGATEEYDDVDAFGLDEFGQPRGLNPLWGAVAGSGLGTVAAMGLRRWGSGRMAKYAEPIGFGLAAATAGTMIAFKGSRAAGWTALAAAFLNNGLRSVEEMMAGRFDGVAGWGGVVVNPTTSFQGYGGGMGLVEVQPTTSFQDAALPQLVGASLQSASDHVQLVGGPALNAFSGHWGATLFG
jgi:hypothetical protein